MNFYKVVARPTLLYGREAWVTTKRDMNRLEGGRNALSEMRGYRRLDKIRSEILRKKLEIPGIQDVRTKYKRNWINHLDRMDNTRLPKHALNYKPEDEEIVDAPGKDDNASMPEQVKRPNPWRKMMIIII